MKINLKDYKENFHFSVNYFSVFLIVTFIPDFFSIDNLLVKYTFWAIKLLLAIWVIAKSKFIPSYFTPVEYLYFLLVIIYIINLYFDIFIHPLAFLQKSVGIIDFFSFILSVVIAISFRYDTRIHSENSLMIFWITLTIGLVIAYINATESFDLDSASVRYDANSTVNSINYGIAGCSLAIISLFCFISIENNKILKSLFIVTFVIGLVSIAKAGSRSPVVVLAAVSAFYFISRYGSLRGLLIYLLAISILHFYLDEITILLESMGSSLGERLARMVNERETSGRDNIYLNTISIIKEYPLSGAYYVIPSGVGFKGYPHNFILEAFLATGLLGGLPFILLLIISLKKSYLILKIKHPSSWVTLIYLQILGYGMFSTSLYSSQDYWALLYFVLTIHTFKRLPNIKNVQDYKVTKKELVLS